MSLSDCACHFSAYRRLKHKSCLQFCDTFFMKEIHIYVLLQLAIIRRFILPKILKCKINGIIAKKQVALQIAPQSYIYIYMFFFFSENKCLFSEMYSKLGCKQEDKLYSCLFQRSLYLLEALNSSSNTIRTYNLVVTYLIQDWQLFNVFSVHLVTQIL